MFVIKCTNNGKYSGMMVAKSGEYESYTKEILRAKIFKTKEEAQRDCCTNEFVVDIGYNAILS